MFKYCLLKYIKCSGNTVEIQYKYVYLLLINITMMPCQDKWTLFNVYNPINGNKKKQT